MSKIYAVVNQKGGVGKTTSAVNTAVFLAEHGKRVLLVDLDPQANATSGLGFDKNTLKRSTYDVLLDACSVPEAVVHYEAGNFDLLPASPGLAGAEVELVNTIGREYRLQQGFEGLDNPYDYVLIDCPPSLGLLTVNALTAAKDGVLIPVQCEYLALEGLSQLTKTLELAQTYLNKNLAIRGLMMTMFDQRTNLSQEVVREVRKHFGQKVFKTIIPRSVRLSEAPSHGQPVNLYAPSSSGAIAYRALAAELIRGDSGKPRQARKKKTVRSRTTVAARARRR